MAEVPGLTVRFNVTNVSPFPADLQFAVWGYAITGDMCEQSALIAEGHDELVPRVWDRTAGDLAGDMVVRGDEPCRRVKDWAALPWLAEHVVRGHEDWPGL